MTLTDQLFEDKLSKIIVKDLEVNKQNKLPNTIVIALDLNNKDFVIKPYRLQLTFSSILQPPC